MLTPLIETKRLILRRYKETDINEMYEIITDERLAKYISFPKLTKEEELDYIKNLIKNSDISEQENWVIELKKGNIPIGNISVKNIKKAHNYCSVGYVIRYDYWGNGYAAEALTAISEYLLNDRNYYLVECLCNELNTQSSKVMLKSGFKKDGYILNRRLNKDGTYSGLEYYSKSKND